MQVPPRFVSHHFDFYYDFRPESVTPVRPGRCFSASFFDTRLATRRRGVFFFFFYRDCRSIFNLIAVIAFFTVESIMDLTDQNIIGSFYKPGKIYIT